MLGAHRETIRGASTGDRQGTRLSELEQIDRYLRFEYPSRSRRYGSVARAPGTT